jgi:KEOPS complex subunit Cgi121
VRLVAGVARVDDVDAFLAALDRVAEAHGATVQAFDARYVVSRAHLRRAVELADRARERGEAVARERSVEILLYAAGRRQIDRALEMGVSEGETPVVVLVDGGDEAAAAAAVAALDAVESAGADESAEAVARADPDGARDGVASDDAERVRRFFDVGEAELGVVAGDLADVVLERVALLDVEK